MFLESSSFAVSFVKKISQEFDCALPEKML
jgi:hypothetical protein